LNQHQMLQDESVEDGTGDMSREEALAGDAAMRQTPLGMSLMHQTGYAANGANGAAVVDPFQGPITGAMPVPLVRVGNTNDNEAEGDGESVTYQTLPSYQERILEAQSQLQASHAGEGGARHLSQADINAISQRLTEMMRTYIRQNGGNPDALSSRVIVPPRELIDHLVEERLNPREVP
jgi:hypothetical protein